MKCYLLEVRAQGQRIEQGTGWLISSDVVVTAFHVVGSTVARQWWHLGPGTDVRYHLLVEGETIILEPLDYDPDADVALLRIVQKDANLTVLKISTVPVQQQLQWKGLGYPAFHQGKPFALSGRIAHLFPDRPKHNLQLTIDQGSKVDWKGISGSPVCVDDLVFGVITEATVEANTGWATFIDAVRRLAVRQGLFTESIELSQQATQRRPDLATLGLAGVFDFLDYSQVPQLNEVLEQSRMSPSSAAMVTRGSLSDSVAEIGKSRQFVLIDGQSGSGKSTLALGAASQFSAQGWSVYTYTPPSGGDIRSIMEELRRAAIVLQPCVVLLDDINLWANSVEIERIASLVSPQFIMIATATFLANDEAARIELHLRANRIELRWEILRPAVIQFLLDNEAAITNWLCNHIPQEPGRRIGYDVLSTPLSEYIARYATEAKTVWQFIFLLRGGWTESSAILERLVADDRADIPVIFAAIEQIAAVEHKVTTEETLNAISSLEADNAPDIKAQWIESVFEKLVNRRLMVKSRDAYTTVHRDWARSCISVAMLPNTGSHRTAQVLLERDFRLDTPQPRRLMILWSWFHYDGSGAGLFLRDWKHRNRKANWSLLIGTAANSSLVDLAMVAARLHLLFPDFRWAQDLANAFAPHEAALISLVTAAGNTDWPLLREIFTTLDHCSPELAARVIQAWKPKQVAELLETTDPMYYETLFWLFPNLAKHSQIWLQSVGEHISWQRLSSQFDRVQPGAATRLLRCLPLLASFGMPLMRSMFRQIVNVLVHVLSASSLQHFDFEAYDSNLYWMFFPKELCRIAQHLDANRLATELSTANPFYWGRLLTFSIYSQQAGSLFGEQLVSAIDADVFTSNARKYRDASAHQWRVLLWQLSQGSSQARTNIAKMMYEDILYVARRDPGERHDIFTALTAINHELAENLATDLGSLLTGETTNRVGNTERDQEASQHIEALIDKLASLDEKGENYDIGLITGLQITTVDEENASSGQTKLAARRPVSQEILLEEPGSETATLGKQPSVAVMPKSFAPLPSSENIKLSILYRHWKKISLFCALIITFLILLRLSCN